MRRLISRSKLVSCIFLGALLLAACGSSTTTVVSSPSGLSLTATAIAATASAGTPGGSSPTAMPTSSGGGSSPTPTPTSAPHSPTATPAPSYGDGSSNLFVHIAKPSTIHTTSDNSTLDSTYLDNPNLNGNPNARVYVTPNWSYNGTNTYDNHHIGVWYDFAVGRWAIFNEDQAQMPANASFNVLTNSATNSYFFTVTSSSGNISGDGVETGITDPNLIVLAIHYYTPGNFNNHGLGVWYNGSQWLIFNEDQASMATGESFFVVDQPAASIDTIAQVTGSNQDGDSVILNDSAFNGNPSKLLFVMPNWTYNSNHVYDNAQMGVWYSSGQWLIFKENAGTMPLNMGFNVLIQG
jgi:hypothetical protein